MSNFMPDDRHWLMGCAPQARKLTPMEEALVLTTWDSETEQDIVNITKNMLRVKQIKRMCVAKLLVAGPEQLVTILLLGKTRAAMHRSCVKLYWKFLRGKISLVEFNKSLMSETKESIII